MIISQPKTSFLWVVFDVDHNFEGPRAPKAHLDTAKETVVSEKTPPLQAGKGKRERRSSLTAGGSQEAGAPPKRPARSQQGNPSAYGPGRREAAAASAAGRPDKAPEARARKRNMRSPAQLASDKAEAAPSKQQARSEGTRQEVARRGAEIEARTAGGAAVARPRPPVTPVGARSMALYRRPHRGLRSCRSMKAQSGNAIAN